MINKNIFKNKKGKRGIALFEIFLVLSLTIAVSVMMSEPVAAAGFGGTLGLNSEANAANTAQAQSIVTSGGTGVNSISTIPSGSSSVAAATTTTTGAGTSTAITFDAQHPIISTFQGGAWNGGALGSLTAGVAWAAVAYIAAKLIGNMIGLKDGAQKALENAVLAGGFTAGFLHSAAANMPNLFGATSGPLNFMTVGQGIPAGLIIAAAVFILTYSDTYTKTVTYKCMPYEPPLGGKDCEKCNNDPFRPCSEYRCRSLGQACQLLNANSAKPLCTWVNRNDVNSPTITPNASYFAPNDVNLVYTPLDASRPGALGVSIKSRTGSNGCLPAFTPLEFGFNTNKPAQCKIDLFHVGVTQNMSGTGAMSAFDDMQYYVGDNNYYDYNHVQKMLLPNVDLANASSSPIIKNDGTMSLYVRCRDANGNFNVDEFEFKYCVDKSPDTTAPVIEGTSIQNNGYIRYAVGQVPFEIYVNEPSECKWSRIDQDYAGMENSFNCANTPGDFNAQLSYTCKSNLTGIKDREDNTYYIKCRDVSEKLNVMTQSYLNGFVLKGTQPLTMVSVGPNGTIYGSTDIVNVTLNAETADGAEEGKSVCYFSPSGQKDSFIAMANTDSYLHSQRQDLSTGAYGYFYRCIDAGGNVVEANTNFTVYVDRIAPTITRVYKEGEDSLKIVTDEDAQCVYSLTDCKYSIKDATLKFQYASADNNKIHYAKWDPASNYYIKCRDQYGNEPNPGTCSLIASAVRLSTN